MAGRAWGREAQLRVGLEHGRIEALTGKDAQDTSDEVGGAEGGRQSLGPDAIAGADGGRCDEAAHTWAGEAAAAAAAARAPGSAVAQSSFAAARRDRDGGL